MESIFLPRRAPRGFTLIELLVVTAIIVVITAVIFSSQGSFANTVTLSSTAYDVALSLNDAQTYGLGTRALATTPNAGYGLDFKRALPHSYVFFADSSPAAGGSGFCHPLPDNGAKAPNAYPGNCVYNAADTLIANYTLGNNITISNFCAYNGAWACSKTCGATPSCTTNLTQLDIVFLRPNATLFIAENAIYTALPTVSQECVTLKSPNGNTRSVAVAVTGQIIATAATCP
jgi:prepilin-type N-terminal cleavage/methylation domain-containing protein